MKNIRVTALITLFLFTCGTLAGCTNNPSRFENPVSVTTQRVRLPESEATVFATVEPSSVPAITPTNNPISTPIATPTNALLQPSATSTPVPTRTNTPIPPAPTRTSTPAPATLLLSGLSRFGIWLGGGDANRVNLLRDTGAKWARVTLSWAQIEPAFTEPATYNFTSYDSLLGNLGRAGINTLVEIRGNPSWAAGTGCGPIDKEDGTAAFGRFLKALAQRYKETPYNVRHWELINEPDNTDVNEGKFLGGCWGSYPVQYVALLQLASTEIKGVDPQAKIVLGGIAYESIPAFFNPRFLDEILAAGGGRYFDIVNVHYFSSQSPTWAAYGRDIAGKVEAVRQAMSRYSVAKPVIVSESSWTSSPANAADFQDKQAQYVPKLLARCLALDLYAVFWFALAEWQGADYPYGLLNLNLQPRLSYQAYQVAASELRDARSVRPLIPGEMGVPGVVEGYSFQVGHEERWVVWSEGPTMQVRLPSRTFEARDKLGQTMPLRIDGGEIPFNLDSSPVFIRLAVR